MWVTRPVLSKARFKLIGHRESVSVQCVCHHTNRKGDSTMSYTHLNRTERDLIYRMQFQGHSQSAIARTLGRHKSTISRELRRYRNVTGHWWSPEADLKAGLARRLIMHQQHTTHPPARVLTQKRVSSRSLTHDIHISIQPGAARTIPNNRLGPQRFQPPLSSTRPTNTSFRFVFQRIPTIRTFFRIAQNISPSTLHRLAPEFKKTVIHNSLQASDYTRSNHNFSNSHPRLT